MVEVVSSSHFIKVNNIVSLSLIGLPISHRPSFVCN